MARSFDLNGLLALSLFFASRSKDTIEFAEWPRHPPGTRKPLVQYECVAFRECKAYALLVRDFNFPVNYEAQFIKRQIFDFQGARITCPYAGRELPRRFGKSSIGFGMVCTFDYCIGRVVWDTRQAGTALSVTLDPRNTQ